MTRLYVIRHAEAEGNVFRRMDGHYDSNLTPNGLLQVAALERRFADVPVDAVYASDLCRTRRTAEAIYRSKGLPLHPEPRLREAWFGDWEDVPFGQLDFEAPQQMEDFLCAPECWRVNGAERYEEVGQRFSGVLAEIASRHPAQTVAVFTHGCVSSWGFRWMFGDAMRDAGRCDNTGVTLLEWENDTFTPVFFYDNRHLPEEISTLERQRWWRGTHEFNLRYRDLTPQDATILDPVFPPRDGHCQRLVLRMEQPVGYLSFDPETAELSCLYLIPEKRGLRMGPQLLGEAVCACRARGHKRLWARIPPECEAALALLRSFNTATTVQSDGSLLAELDIRVR